ncbi:class IIb bacteriocin, lactobin A/cerein 7B family [Bacteroides xylanisolvens]|nr:class IIb bacteriocin, lactobin A/cerein 7B family [Bacteroides xylanisolvens]MBV3621506.1 class IIb bacteriocin, lactobin A/cerein 7B family [Bacteroides xylanisolvens]
MKELNKNELIDINGGVDPVTVATLLIAAAGVYVQILDHCYNVGKD